MTSASIKLKNVDVVFPVYNASSLSLKNRALNTITGGAIHRHHDGISLVKGLENINLNICSGERVGLVGHNGAGKTTLLRILSGIFEPTSGKAEIRGSCNSLINIGLGIDPEATGRENILLRGVMMGLKPSQIRRNIDEIIDFTGLGQFIDLPFRTYSTGMQMRLAFAVSTGISPEILIMDEWLSTGDEEFSKRANQRISEIVNRSEILILASHSHDLLSSNCNRVIWLEHGKIRMDDKSEVVLKAYFGS